MSVCVDTSMARADIELRANLENPAGSTLRWVVSDDDTFKGGQPNPLRVQQIPILAQTLPTELLMTTIQMTARKTTLYGPIR